MIFIKLADWNVHIFIIYHLPSVRLMNWPVPLSNFNVIIEYIILDSFRIAFFLSPVIQFENQYNKIKSFSNLKNLFALNKIQNIRSYEPTQLVK